MRPAALRPSLPHPRLAGDVASRATQLYRASTPAVIHAQAPVLLLERVVESDLCAALIDYWQHHDKLANRVGSAEGNVVNSDIKRRLDVQLDDPPLFMRAARLPGAPRRAGDPARFPYRHHGDRGPDRRLLRHRLRRPASAAIATTPAA